MKNAFFATLLVIAGVVQAETKIPSGAGDKGTYYIMSNQIIHGRNLVVSRREGPSGTSYSAREVDCIRETFRYVAEGDTFEEMKKNSQTRVQDMRMSPVTNGSASYYVVKAACK